MKITEVKVWLVEGVKYNWTMIKIYTDTGHSGVGEATNWPGSPIIEAAARHAGERIIGLDPLRPTVPDEVGSYQFEYNSPRGLIGSRWRASGNDVEWSIIVPPNSTATVSVPGKNIQGADVPGVEFLNEENGRVNYKVKSGIYSFSFTKP